MPAEQRPSAEPNPPTPPAEADEQSSYERTIAWPRNLAIASILFAVCGGVGSTIMLFLEQGLEKQAATEAQKAFIRTPLIQTSLTASSVFGGIGLILAAALLVAAVGLIRRRAWSIKVLAVWAWLKIILELTGMILDYLTHQRIEEAISRGMVEPENVVYLLRSWTLSGGLVSFAIICSLAIFALIWLAREETREQIATWR